LIKGFTEKIESLFWSPGVFRLAWPLRTGVHVLRFIYAVLRDSVAGNLPLRAMGLVYITILSIVPVIAISFSVLKGFGFHRQLEPLLYNFLAPMGERGIELTNQVIAFVENIKGDVLAGVGLVLLFVTTVSMAQKVEDSFNYVWRVERNRSLAQRLSEYLSVILVGPVVMVTALTLIASVRSTALVRQLSDIEPIGSTFLLVGQLAPYALVALGFTFVYWFLPNTRVRLSAALVGGISGGFLWATAGVLFARFVEVSTRTVSIYTTFAIVIIALIWLYLCWLILLVGAQVAFYWQNPSHLRIGYRPISIGGRQREQIALSIMSEVASAFRDDSSQPALSDIAAELQLPGIALLPVVDRLEAAGLLTRTARDRLLPGRDPAQITLKQVLDAVREPQTIDIFPEGRWPGKVRELSRDLSTASGGVLAKRSLYDLTPVPDPERESSGS
jgi:membrane protein